MREREKSQQDSVVRFGAYRLDLASTGLWRGTQEVKVTGKALGVLHYFVAHPGHLVSKEELFQAVWPQTVVSDATLASCIQELRQALRDDARKPRYIETVHRRGYRFIAPLLPSQPVSSSKFQVSSSQSAIRIPQSAITLVGRETELVQLHGWLKKALQGERQIVFVTGEPGIGKTALVEAFLTRLANEHEHEHEIRIARGQCIEHYGAGEAYLPILEALGRLCREPGGERLIELLYQHAPTWLVQMPALLTTADLEVLQRKTAGATRERMLRELAEAIEVVTTERPVVLVLEDLHWSDVSTLDWLAFLARRAERARLVVIGTYRPVEILAREHPLKGVKQELQMHGQCQELALDFLREEHVAEYLTQRFASPSPASAGEGRGEGPSQSPFQRLARVIHRRTDGNPLFMVNVVNHLIAHGVIAQVDGQWVLQGGEAEVARRIPEDLRQLIERQTERLNPAERAMLEVASVAGAEFSAAAVAAGVETTVEAVEEQCAELARHEQFLQASGTSEWPDGTVATRYRFQHALYQEVLYERLPAARRQRLHRQIGERQEAAYGERAREIATELALHFERGRDHRKAIQYLQQAGENASRRSAYAEAISLFTRGLVLLKTLPDTPERTQQELLLQISLGVALMTSKGYAAPEVEAAYARAHELCQQLEDTPQLFPVLFGLLLFYSNRGEFKTALELDRQLQHLIQRHQDPLLLAGSHHTSGLLSFLRGEFASAQTSWARCLALYEPQQAPVHLLLYGHDLGVVAGVLSVFVCWLRGYPEQALSQAQAALALADDLSHPLSLAFAHFWVASLYQGRREVQAVQAHAEGLMSLAQAQGIANGVAHGLIIRGWALAEQGQVEEGIAQIREGLAKVRAIGIESGQTQFLAMLAEAYEQGGQAEEGLSVLAEALAQVDKTGKRFCEAELYRLKGELTLQKFQVPSSRKSEVRGPKSGVRKRKSRDKGQKKLSVTSSQLSVTNP
jgi:DNA-binding winged helix-turn-helix (wHTH) protein/predicted ATPase